MSRVFVCGLGAVSPAGWTLASLREALALGAPAAVQALARSGKQVSLRSRLVPPPAARPAFLAHPRLRRTSPITHYAAAAALEALGNVQAKPDPARRLGLIGCFQSGCVQYSCRFFEEVLKDPGTASPLVFPETVFAAPTSHLATLLGNVDRANSLVGDPACFLQGLALAAEWLEAKRVDVCVVAGAEESHWLLGDALSLFECSAIISSGAGAICLSLNAEFSLGAELNAITDAHTFSNESNRSQAARLMRSQLPPGSLTELLCDGIADHSRADEPERLAWNDWPGKRLSPKRILGEGLMAAAAWQCVAGADAVARRESPAANVSLVGCNQQAIGARFIAA